MEYDWDEAKNLVNLQKHAIDFADCCSVFDGVTVTMEDDRERYAERRFVTFGLLGRQVVAVTHTERADLIRIISARKATRREHDFFFSEIGHRLDSS